MKSAGCTSFRFRFRYVVTIMISIASAADYMTRVNLNVAMVSMARPFNKSDGTDVMPMSTCPGRVDPSLNSSAPTDATGRQFDWDEETQGLILGAFFWSYVLVQIPAGRIAEMYGAKWIIAVSLIGSGLVNLITPYLSDYIILLIASRVVLGFLQGGVFPASYSMISKWFPQKERSVAFTCTDIGGTVGGMLGNSVAGYLSENGVAGVEGWPSAFYVSGLVGIVCFFIFIPFMSSSPENSRFVSAEELEEIQGKRDEEDLISSKKSNKSTPWRALLTSPPVIAYIVVKASGGLSAYVGESKMPEYMSSVLHIHPTEIGFTLSLLSIITIFCVVITSYASELLIKKNWFSRTTVRKLFNSISMFGKAACFSLVTMFACSKTMFLSLKVLEYILSAFGAGGSNPVASEMTTNYPATIFSIGNTLGTSFGFVAPSFAGYILESGWSDDLITLWRYVFWSCSALQALGGIVFIIFASAERQAWDKDDAISFEESCNESDSILDANCGLPQFYASTSHDENHNECENKKP